MWLNKVCSKRQNNSLLSICILSMFHIFCPNMANTPLFCANLSPIYPNSIYVDHKLIFIGEEMVHLLQAALKEFKGDSRFGVQDHFKAT